MSWRPRPLQGKHLLQGLGYVLLDYDDAYRLAALGLYFPRQRRRVSWPLVELLPRLCGTIDLAALRADFRKAVAGTKRVSVPS